MPSPIVRKPQNLFQLEEPLDPNKGAPSMRAFLELAFRPLYLAGVAWALVAIAIWIYAPQTLTGPLQGIAWHAHEMLWGFIATIAVGFLMTAGSNWTGINPLQGRALAVASVLWLVARVGYLAGSPLAFWIAVAAELGFFLLAAGVSGYVLWQDAAGKRQAVRIQRPIGDARIPPPVQHSQRGN